MKKDSQLSVLTKFNKCYPSFSQRLKYYLHQKPHIQGFPGGPVVKNPPAKEGDTGSTPGPGRSHMPWSN